MRKYIIITLSITNVGGAEQYVYNKSEFLKKKGYDVYVFSSLDRPIIIDGLKQYKKYIIPALMYSPLLFTKKHVDSLIEKVAVLSDIKCGDEVCIETHNVHPGLWGELIAKRFLGTHVILNLQEKHEYSNREKEYLWFKLKRKELAGITETSVSQMFEKKIKFKSWMKFGAFCNNVVYDVNDKFSDKLNSSAKYTFASIGRLEKEFLIPMISTLIQYFRKHSKEQFNLLLIGGSNEVGMEERIREMIKNENNVKLVITGFLYPIPRALIKKVDLFISTAGSCTVSYNEGIKTIKVHPVTAEPTQIMGYTFDDVYNHSMFETLPNTTLLNQIEIALGDIQITFPDKDYSYEMRMNTEFERQLSYFKDQIPEYYDVYKVYPPKSIKTLAYYFLGKVFGDIGMQKILERVRKNKYIKKGVT